MKPPKPNLTFIDGTTACPVCGSGMTRFRYKRKAVGNVSRRTDYAQMKNITTWTETTYAGGYGYLCPACYRKRQLRFWAVFGVVLLAAALMIILGAVLPVKPLMYVGLGVIGVMLILIFSKRAAELFDLGDRLMRMSKAEQEFVSLLVREHPGAFRANDKVEAVKAG